MGRGDTYKRQRAHVMRENPKFLELGENGGPPSRDSIIEEFNRLVADNAYGRNPKAGADRPAGGIIPMSPPLKAVDLNKPNANNIDGTFLSMETNVEKSAKKAKKEPGAKPKTKRPQLEDIVLEPKEVCKLSSFAKETEETPTTGGFDWVTDLAAHVSSSPDKPVGGHGDGEITHKSFVEEDGWNTVRSNRSNRGRQPGLLELNTESRVCFNCGQEGHRKIECTAPPKISVRTCHKCHEEGHIARDCPAQVEGFGDYSSTDNRVCFNCNQTGHISRDCPAGGPGKGGAECFNCGELGHKSFECSKGGGSVGPSRSGKSGSGGCGCYKCGQPGHFARECPGGDGSGFEDLESPPEPFPAFVDNGFGAAADDDNYNW